MKFGYKRLITGVERPIIPVIVKNPANDERVRYFGLIDSGSDTCLFDAAIGELLGLDLSAGREESIGGIIEGVRRPSVRHTVDLWVGGWPFRVEGYFMRDLTKLGYGILGRKGFFDQFKSVKFSESKGEIELFTM